MQSNVGEGESERERGPSVTLVDLGLGNLHSVVRALERIGVDAEVSSEPEVISAADRLIVPGQGAFRDGAEVVAGPVGDALRAFLETGRPYLGICLGMQLLFEGSEEAPGARGLGWFPGEVKGFPRGRREEVSGRILKVPHMGWNEVESEHLLFGEDSWFYFVHSYFCVPKDPDLTVAVAHYGEPFCAAIARDRVFACQFHPEKSHRAGESLLRRFMELSCA